jgi:hypothetical protein
MGEDVNSYGSRLYAALRQLTGYTIITSKLDYPAIQRLKSADRELTLKLFSGSSFEVLQELKTKEPEEVAQFLADEADRAARQRVVNTIVIVAVIGGIQMLG